MVILIQASQKLLFAPDTSQVSLSMEPVSFRPTPTSVHTSIPLVHSKISKKSEKQIFHQKQVPIDVCDDIEVVRGPVGVSLTHTSRHDQHIRTVKR